jgi:Coenzyme PQQ synthesis protein D (PqqD)
VLLDHPKRRSDLSARQVDDEMVVLDRRTERIHQLNTTASFVWDRCDGACSMDEIAGGIMETFDVDALTAAQDVAEIVRQFADLGLLEGRP